ncbi:hypothetical protein DFQ30_009610 [Apophysomyces sp. BC1015]|nr:hypothetical protein DFQ30_009610 [Apophysomyces sp. BC1015]
MFSRFDNMMQHTQTHRPKRDRPNFATRSSSRKQHRVTHEPWLHPTKKRRPDLCVETREDHTFSGGLVSPVSDDDEMCHHKRRMSVAELCNPIESKVYLTRDELEAVQAFDRLRRCTH